MNLKQFKEKLDESIGYTFISRIKPSDLIKSIEDGIDTLNLVKQFRSFRKEIYANGSINENDYKVKEFFHQALRMEYKIKFPRITIINSRDILGVSLEHLKHLLIDEYLEKRIIFERCIFGNKLNYDEMHEIKLQFKSSLIQAIEYLNNAIKADLAISPVLLYYSLVNFLYCYSLLKYKDAIPDQTYKKHGIEIFYRPSNDDLLSTEIKILDSSNIKPYMLSNNLKLKNDTYSIWDALKSLNYMTTSLSRFGIDNNVLRIYDQSNDTLKHRSPLGIFPSRISYETQHFLKLTDKTISSPNDVGILINFLMPAFNEFFDKKTVKIHETHLELSSIGELGVIDFCPQYLHQKEIIDFLATHRDHNNDRFLILEKKTNINDPIFHIYTSSYFLGYISRYQPELWYKFIGKEAHKVLIEKYINSSAIFILYKFLTIFSGEFLVFK